MKKPKNDNILIFSYYANLPGACQAEWLDDKLVSLKALGKQLTVISSPSSRRYRDIVHHVKCCSMSWHDYKDELMRAHEQGLPIYKLLLAAPFSFVFGNLSDWMQKMIVNGVGEGRWSWLFSAFISGLINVILRGRPDVILTTGGPASAHIAGIVLGKLINRPVICELQDPLSGGDIGRNANARGLLFRVEQLISRHAAKVAYVTDSAAEYARKNVNSKARIEGIYPGAPKLFTDNTPRAEGTIDSNIRFIHTGSLYSSRNFDSLLSAIEDLKHEGVLSECTIVNLGHVENKIAKNLEKYPYVSIEPLQPRLDALKYASTFDVLLLIQNNDERSQVTIPYKTYDYLNLNRLILGLTNSAELKRILIDAGHVSCDVSDVEQIKSAIKNIVKNRLQLQKIERVSPFDAERSVFDLISL